MDVQDPQFKTLDGSALRMWRDAAKNNFLTEKYGRPIFDDVILVEVISPGSRDSSPVFELVRTFAKEMDHPEPLRGIKYDEYKDYIAQFERSEDIDASMSGTPLGQWPEMTKTFVAALRAQNIFTVDALANLPDSKLMVVGPDGRTWREKAKAYIESAKSSAYSTELAAELERQRGINADQQRQISELADQIATMQANSNNAAPEPERIIAEPTSLSQPASVAVTPPKATKTPPAPPPPVEPII